MATIETPCRVAIYVKVTDIEGNPLSRHITLGQAFCSNVLQRELQSQIRPEGYDNCHIPAGFDSENGICVYFLFDLGVTGPLPGGDASKIPHFVYLASRAQGDWKFIPRPRAIEKAKHRTRTYPWGGRVELEMFAALSS
ncbi:hypothetical protein CC80DRAFT_7407 [Byssothecium circinans]|uniref:Uncharacterized protein n=1 Tax=Byssothecium circinans TaxID=147558 RepID=A0A6A5UKQ8_9PLEO|nr:hypothetical protein CC80DRAFT_7407 [Byssothecium circinans]